MFYSFPLPSFLTINTHFVYDNYKTIPSCSDYFYVMIHDEDIWKDLAMHGTKHILQSLYESN